MDLISASEWVACQAIIDRHMRAFSRRYCSSDQNEKLQNDVGDTAPRPLVSHRFRAPPIRGAANSATMP